MRIYNHGGSIQWGGGHVLYPAIALYLETLNTHPGAEYDSLYLVSVFVHASFSLGKERLRQEILCDSEGLCRTVFLGGRFMQREESHNPWETNSTDRYGPGRKRAQNHTEHAGGLQGGLEVLVPL